MLNHKQKIYLIKYAEDQAPKAPGYTSFDPDILNSPTAIINNQRDIHHKTKLEESKFGQEGLNTFNSLKQNYQQPTFNVKNPAQKTEDADEIFPKQKSDGLWPARQKPVDSSKLLNTQQGNIQTFDSKQTLAPFTEIGPRNIQSNIPNLRSLSRNLNGTIPGGLGFGDVMYSLASGDFEPLLSHASGYFKDDFLPWMEQLPGIGKMVSNFRLGNEMKPYMDNKNNFDLKKLPEFVSKNPDMVKGSLVNYLRKNPNFAQGSGLPPAVFEKMIYEMDPSALGNFLGSIPAEHITPILDTAKQDIMAQ